MYILTGYLPNALKENLTSFQMITSTVYNGCMFYVVLGKLMQSYPFYTNYSL